MRIEPNNLLYLAEQDAYAKVLRVAAGLDERVIQVRVREWHISKESAIAKETGQTSFDSTFVQKQVEYSQMAYTLQQSPEGDLLHLTLPADVDISLQEGDLIRLLDQLAEAPIVRVLPPEGDGEAPSTEAESPMTRVSAQTNEATSEDTASPIPSVPSSTEEATPAETETPNTIWTSRCDYS